MWEVLRNLSRQGRTGLLYFTKPIPGVLPVGAFTHLLNDRWIIGIVKWMHPYIHIFIFPCVHTHNKKLDVYLHFSLFPFWTKSLNASKVHSSTQWHATMWKRTKHGIWKWSGACQTSAESECESLSLLQLYFFLLVAFSGNGGAVSKIIWAALKILSVRKK